MWDHAAVCGSNNDNQAPQTPPDPIALAKLIGDIATGQVADAAEDTRDPAAVALGRRGVVGQFET
jgi:hypothetical protein